MMFRVTSFLPFLVVFSMNLSAVSSAADNEFAFELRFRKETKVDSGRFHVITEQQNWQAKQTAFIVCDMWDLHHCLNATRRGAEVAPRMNAVLADARQRGATIIHAPSSCMDPYKDHPARARALAVPRTKTPPVDIEKWCYQIPAEEQGVYPIDQSDGGEDDDLEEHAAWAKKLEAMGRNPRAPWKSQTDLLDIDADRDYISDDGVEVWSVLEKHEIKNVVLVGVHTNMCVLGRPFGLRNMASNGKNVVLMRDMTDTMYNPLMPPYVSHFTGTDLIIEHIEKWVCPTVTSDQVLGGEVFHFKNDRRPHVVMIVGEREYGTKVTLPKFAAEHLGKEFRVSFVFVNTEERNDFPGMDVLETADVALISARRRALPEAQMKILRRFVEQGKPVLGIRTANHAFSLRGETPPAGCLVWEDFDREVIGGNYSTHHGNDAPNVEVSLTTSSAGKHAILAGVDLAELEGTGSLYVVSPLVKTATPLLTGAIPNHAPEPIAWVNQSTFGGKVFYTSLGAAKDFEQPAMNQLLKNAIHWAAGIPVQAATVAKK